MKCCVRGLQSTAATLKVAAPSRRQFAGANDIQHDIKAKIARGATMSGSLHPIRLLVVGLLTLGLVACGEPGNVTEKRSGPSGDRSKRDLQAGLGGRNQETGTIFGPGGIFGSKADKKEGLGEGSGVAVNAYLWRASLDTINFIPLVSADPFGGVIITDWYTPAEAPNERMKVQITILDRDLRADGVRVAVFKQTTGPKNANWVDAQVDQRTNTDIENAILTRARQLRIAQGG
jgi:hypothetical protein